MRIRGKVTLSGSDYELGHHILCVTDANGNKLVETGTQWNGVFNFEVGEALRPARLQLCAPSHSTTIIESRLLNGTDQDIDWRVDRKNLESAGLLADFQWSIASLQFSGGEWVSLSPNSLTLVVGPNSAGKSRALREIAEGCGWGHSDERVVVQEVHTNPIRPPLWLVRGWIRENYPTRAESGVEVADFTEARISINNAVHNQDTSKFLVFSISTEQRLKFSAFHRLGDITQPPENMIDHVFRHDDVFNRISAATKSAFGVGLVQEFGPMIGLRVGELPAGENADRASGDYRRMVQQYVRLEDAGDGIRSFVGTLIALEACPHPVLMIDEPEAFLHPPQARVLGKRLAEASRTRQIIVSTHSADIVLGALSVGNGHFGAAPEIRISRINRRGTLNHVTSIDPQVLQSLTRDPQWESSDLVAALFHAGVVLCEADADRRFYRWMNPHPDVTFFACNGKGGIARAATALRTLGVPVIALVDFDVLGTDGELRSIINSLGGSADTILAGEYRNIVHQLTNGGKLTSQREILAEATSIVSEFSSREDRPGLLKRLSQLIESAKAGYEAKKHGINRFGGGLHQACRDLLSSLGKIGLYVVPHGELEGWWRAGPTDKAEWIAQAWTVARTAPETFKEARAFLELAICTLLETDDLRQAIQ